MTIDITLAKNLCLRFEGFRSHPYRDVGGYATIGFGTRFYSNGEPVTMTDQPVTFQIAEILLNDALLHRYLPKMLETSPVLNDLPITANAILDFCYNLGWEHYADSTLRDRIDEKDWARAKDEIVKWDHAGGTVQQGLLTRRQAEAEMIGTDK